MTDIDTLMELVDAYAEARHIQGHSTYNIKTAAARRAVIEALSGVQALSAAPAIGDELRDTLVAVSAAIAEQDDRTAQKMIREILEASPTPPAEQATTTEAATPKAGVTTGAALGGVYAELPQPDSWFHFTPQYWENTLRDFADRTHALRMKQAAPKAAPGELFDSEGFRAWVRKNLPDDTIIGNSEWWANHLTVWAQRFAKAAPQQEAQEPCQTCTAMARTVMMDQVSFDRKPDCYGIRQITDDDGIEEWEDIRTSPDVAREEANDMMATGRGEIYEVVPLWTTPQPAPAPLSDDAKDVVRDAAFEAVRKKLCALPRFSFLSDGYGVRRVPDKSGSWIAFDAAHELFDPVAVDAALAAQGGK